MGEHHAYEHQPVDVSSVQHPHLHGEEGEIDEDVEDDCQKALAKCFAVVLRRGQGLSALRKRVWHMKYKSVSVSAISDSSSGGGRAKPGNCQKTLISGSS